MTLLAVNRRTNFWLAIIATFAINPPLKADEPNEGSAVYDLARVHQVHIQLTAKEFEAIQPRGGRGFGFPGPGGPPAAPQAPADPDRDVHRNDFGMDLPWGTGAVTFDDESFENVGIRYKGNGTIGDSSRTIKKSFKIDLDREGGDGRFAGSKTVNLHCGVTDPTKCRETLAYELYRAAGVPAPRTTLAEVRLTVEGKYDREVLGIYTIVEDVGSAFLKDHFGAGKGLLMKPERLRDFDDRGDDWAAYQESFGPERKTTAAETERLIAFARLVDKGDDDSFRERIGSFLDIDEYLRFLATTAYLSNSDSFFVLGHNFYIYLHPTTQQLQFIPWDLDRAFGNFGIFGSHSQQMDLSFVHPYTGTHKLTERLLAIPELQQKYDAILKELATTAFSKDRLLAELERVESAVKEPLARDTAAAEARKDGRGGFGPPGMFGTPPDLKEFIEKRTGSLEAQLAGTSKGHIPAGGFGPFGGPGGPPKIGAMMAPALFGTLDTDHDSHLSRDEWLQLSTKLFDASQKDDDKAVDLPSLTAGVTQLLPAPPGGGPAGGGPPGGFSPARFMAEGILKRADKDENKKLTSEEISGAAGDLFDRFDKDSKSWIDEQRLSDLLTDLFPAPAFGPRPGGPPRN
jgi:spore coat protein CotH